ncbi:MAG: hypothetical protein A2X17_05085 [Bacteroidetes bacterium GWF2_41_61]|nr:MAG: hypothetical protein A2X20_07745 [Bacteroidetes bacterium GWE2_40_15]OFY36788.1 MAG: hypothetical protein A2X17_05085 [Bacteroidetes bacterium GWF2_41_61]OFY88727.1 MAG: hypothetical protein A2266_02545 [Bacteroidetes bacterium RIFOXYA12_FULL_40_10]HBG23867.1 hypothetical protein [Rikenellaceae bacterium]HBZ26032.1 hypothetical protein [Rikenellaceae bacterium]
MKNFLFWFFAVLITITAVIYQRLTGPTNPKRVKFTIENIDYKVKFPRTSETLVTLTEAVHKNIQERYSKLEFKVNPVLQDNFTIKILFKRYPSGDSLQQIEAINNNGVYSFDFPSQPPAGKLIYYPVLVKDGSEVVLCEEEGVIIRFKSPVPSFVLIPHILLMFIAMLLANYSGITAFYRYEKSLKYAYLVLIALGIGGLILGPIVQKYAFGAFWTGWPFGEDLTDNKTLVAFLFWVAALALNRTKPRKYLLILAAVVTLMVYCIPHSTGGSEYDHEKGAVVTGR